MVTPITDATPRRSFLANLAAVSAGLGLSSTLTACATAEPTMQAPSAAADPLLQAWFAKITGDHKQVFDAPEPNSGMVAIWPRVYLNTMKETFGEKDTSTAVVILRHGALPLSMNDEMWAKYNFGEMFKIDGPDGKPAKSNIYASITGLPISGLGIAELLSAGVLVGACDVAMMVYSSAAAAKMGVKAEDVKAEWIANVLTGVQIVPSGVLGVGRAQELGCSYCFAG